MSANRLGLACVVRSTVRLLANWYMQTCVFATLAQENPELSSAVNIFSKASRDGTRINRRYYRSAVPKAAHPTLSRDLEYPGNRGAGMHTTGDGIIVCCSQNGKRNCRPGTEHARSSRQWQTRPCNHHIRVPLEVNIIGSGPESLCGPRAILAYLSRALAAHLS
jgi:hypothetical protein